MSQKHGAGIPGNYKTQYRTCMDCPANMPAIGGKKRCATCADKFQQERNRRQKRKQAMKGGEI